MNDRWKPVLKKNETYCSEACGRGCTKQEYDSAVKDAASLVAQLGPDWKPEIRESSSSGWHSSVTKQDGYVSKENKRYFVLLRFSGQDFMGRGNTAKSALKIALKNAKDLSAHLAKEIKKFET